MNCCKHSYRDRPATRLLVLYDCIRDDTFSAYRPVATFWNPGMLRFHKLGGYSPLLSVKSSLL